MSIDWKLKPYTITKNTSKDLPMYAYSVKGPGVASHWFREKAAVEGALRAANRLVFFYILVVERIIST